MGWVSGDNVGSSSDRGRQSEEPPHRSLYTRDPSPREIAVGNLRSLLIARCTRWIRRLVRSRRAMSGASSSLVTRDPSPREIEEDNLRGILIARCTRGIRRLVRSRREIRGTPSPLVVHEGSVASSDRGRQPEEPPQRS